MTEAERIIADANQFAASQAKRVGDAEIVKNAAFLAYLQGFKEGMKHAIATSRDPINGVVS